MPASTGLARGREPASRPSATQTLADTLRAASAEAASAFFLCRWLTRHGQREPLPDSRVGNLSRGIVITGENDQPALLHSKSVAAKYAAGAHPDHGGATRKCCPRRLAQGDGVAGKSDDKQPTAPMNFPMNGSQCIPLDGEIHDGRHFLTLRVYYEDTDFTGIVHHANFLRYLERGRTNHLRLIAADHRALLEATENEAPGFAFVVRSMTVDFLRPARMDDVLGVVTKPEAVKGASIVLHQRVPIRCASPCAPTRSRDAEIAT